MQRPVEAVGLDLFAGHLRPLFQRNFRTQPAADEWNCWSGAACLNC
jgi:hypothetical protein